MSSKRQKLNFDSQELTQNLKTSTGQGMNAFFSPTSPPSPTASARNKKLIKKDETRQISKRARTHHPVKSSKPVNSTTPEQKTERPERPVRSHSSKRSLQNKRRIRADYRYTPSKQPSNREIRRHSFEIYKDQVKRLQELKVTIMKTGQLRSMSDMVREALDNFLKEYS